MRVVGSMPPAESASVMKPTSPAPNLAGFRRGRQERAIRGNRADNQRPGAGERAAGFSLRIPAAGNEQGPQRVARELFSRFRGQREVDGGQVVLVAEPVREDAMHVVEGGLSHAR